MNGDFDIYSLPELITGDEIEDRMGYLDEDDPEDKEELNILNGVLDQAMRYDRGFCRGGLLIRDDCLHQHIVDSTVGHFSELNSFLSGKADFPYNYLRLDEEQLVSDCQADYANVDVEIYGKQTRYWVRCD